MLACFGLKEYRRGRASIRCKKKQEKEKEKKRKQPPIPTYLPNETKQNKNVFRMWLGENTF